MPITITARHCEISDELKERAKSVLDRLGSVASRPIEGGTVVFDLEAGSATAEIRLKAGRGDAVIATGAAKDHRSALDRAEEKIRRQLEKEAPLHRGRSARDAV